MKKTLVTPARDDAKGDAVAIALAEAIEAASRSHDGSR